MSRLLMQAMGIQQRKLPLLLQPNREVSVWATSSPLPRHPHNVRP